MSSRSPDVIVLEWRLVPRFLFASSWFFLLFLLAVVVAEDRISGAVTDREIFTVRPGGHWHTKTHKYYKDHHHTTTSQHEDQDQHPDTLKTTWQSILCHVWTPSWTPRSCNSPHTHNHLHFITLVKWDHQDKRLAVRSHVIIMYSKRYVKILNVICIEFKINTI